MLRSIEQINGREGETATLKMSQKHHQLRPFFRLPLIRKNTPIIIKIIPGILPIRRPLKVTVKAKPKTKSPIPIPVLFIMNKYEWILKSFQ